jgi:beta-mannosidase
MRGDIPNAWATVHDSPPDRAAFSRNGVDVNISIVSISTERHALGSLLVVDFRRRGHAVNDPRSRGSKNFITYMPTKTTKPIQACEGPEAGTPKSQAAAEMVGTSVSLTGNWSLFFTDGEQPPDPQADSGINCVVPGGIHAALVAAGKANISEELGFIEAMQWEGKHKWLFKDFSWAGAEQSESVWLVFQGVDPQCEVYLNEKLIGSHFGMFGGPSIEVTRFLRNGTNEIQIHISPEKLATDTVRQSLLAGRPHQIDHPGGDSYLKPSQMLGGNDFPRVISAGIWQPVCLETRKLNAVADVWAETKRIHGNAADVLIHGRLHGDTAGKTVELRICAPDGNACGEWIVLTDVTGAFKLQVSIDAAQLWWPNGSGEQPLYELFAAGPAGLAIHRKIGIRTLEWKRNTGTDSDLTITVNSKPVFARGGNWPTLDKTLDFTHASERYKWMLGLARGANVNVIRFWGGYARELDDFYDLCDRLGILVLHDFPVANSVNAQNVDREIYSHQVRTIVRQLRSHPCIAAWMGGNELRQCEILGSPMDHLTALGGEIANQEDPGRRHFASSYLLGSGFTDEYDHYGRRSEALDALKGALAAEPKFSVEFNSGTHTSFVASEGLVEKIMPLSGTAWPPSPAVHLRKINTSPWSQQFMAGSLPARGTSANAAPYRSWEELSYYSDLFNGFAVRAQIGNWRSRIFHCSGALVWCWNDQQAMFGWAAVDYFGAPRALYYFLKRAFAPVAVNFRYLTPELDFRERIRSGVSVVNESGRTLRDYSVRIAIYDSDLSPIMTIGPESEQGTLRSGEKLRLHTSCREIENASALEVIDLNGIGYLFPLFEQCGVTPCDIDTEQKADQRFFGIMVSLHDADERLVSREFYPFNFAWHDNEDVGRLPQAELFEAKSQLIDGQVSYEVTNRSDVPSLWTRFSLNGIAPGDYMLSDNWISILPGESVILTATSRHSPFAAIPELRWRAVNAFSSVNHQKPTL